MTSLVPAPALAVLRRALAATLVAVGATAMAAAFAPAASAAKRVALVIGNSAYEHAGALANPANDATDMATSLRDLGFTVVVGTDLDNRGMRAKLREFSQEIRGADAAMVFYAGHAVQVNGENYLAPVDTKLEYESDVDFETISMEFVLKQMEREVETILVFLDACRDNPITRSLKTGSRSGGAGKGLAETKLSAAGTFLAFATDPGNVALDGKGRNSPFTKALLDNIKRPGVEISTLMTDVRVQVRRETNNAQTPWTNSSLLGHFYFNPAPEAQAASQQVAALETPAGAAQPAAGSTKVDEARVAALAWESVQDSESEATLEYFIATYGDTFYGGLARIRLERLKAGKAAQADSAPQEQEQEPSAGAQAGEAATPAPQAPETRVAAVETKEEARAIEPAFDRREVALAIQKRLGELKCNPGRPDGLWGRRSIGALDAFARDAKVKMVSAQPTPQLLEQLREYDGRGCTVSCSARQRLEGGVCVAKTCLAGQQLSSKGNCFTPRTRTVKSEPAPEPRRQQRVVRQPEPVIVEQPHQQVIVRQPPQQVIVQEPHPVIVQPQPQPQPQRPGLGGIAIGVGACILMGC